MNIEWLPTGRPDAERLWREVLRPIAADIRSAAGELAQRTVARTRAELPDLFPDTQTVAEQLVATEAGLRQLAQIMELGADPRGLELPPSIQAIVRSGVRRQIALADMMRFYRLAQELLWQWIFARIAATARDAAAQSAAVELVTGWIFAYADAAMVRVERIYELEREAWLHTAASARSAAIEEILTGRERDSLRASTQLRYEVNRHHIGAIIWAESGPGDDALPALTGAVAAVGRLVAAETTLVQPMGTLAVASWGSRRVAFDDADLDALRSPRVTRDVPPGVAVAVGEPGHGLDGFRRTHSEAAHARRVAALARGRGETVTRYRDIAVAALATADSAHALDFATRALGALAADDESTYRLAVTLAVYLDENCSRVRAAERLTVHPNTVAYRVRQAEALLGRSVGNDALELRVALAILPTLPGLAHTRSTDL
ncbi:helix-turn-helix domain-containing protein [Nocardia sp. NEAU-G5]|uniref:Helix-turn-helix domain-containing protein n=1 Tax=Nocardia albiluteola TaxID=2842303 RepID=A0ABS6BEB0_9NOCA|nr:helix-turn-helix domain-containing protein [Nocardia albiluteola]MBU3067750.1 helix-turn-helix domain-containing protein [Nocardia albiluteola]